MISVSFIIPSWNAKEYLLKCIDSIVNNCTQYKYEIIIVDNCSSDGSAEAVSKKFQEIQVINLEKNLGFAKACNIGIKKSKGDLLFIVNSDTEVFQENITKMIKYMKKNSDVGILGPRVQGADGRIQRSYMRTPTVWNQLCRTLFLDKMTKKSKFFGGYLMKDFCNDITTTVDIINGCFWVVRKVALKTVGLLDERFFIYGEDMDWCLRFRQKGWKVVYFSGANIIHYGGMSSANAPLKFYIEMQKANLVFWIKHKNKLEVYLYVCIQLLHMFIRCAGYRIIAIFKNKEKKSLYKKSRFYLETLNWYLNEIKYFYEI